jgi:hypothetical protein
VTETNESDSAWFYAKNGGRKGPVRTDVLRELLAKQIIDQETPIWRKGLANWQPLRLTEIGTGLADTGETPPPIDLAHINNVFAWALAVLPLAYMFIYPGIISHQYHYFDGDIAPLSSFQNSLLILIPWAINTSLSLTDLRQIKAAGYKVQSSWISFFAFFSLVPFYLYARTTTLSTVPIHAIIWVVCWLASIALQSSLVQLAILSNPSQFIHHGPIN